MSPTLGVFVMIPPVVSGVVFVEPPGAVGPVEFMTLAGHATQQNCGQKQGDSFHRAAS